MNTGRAGWTPVPHSKRWWLPFPLKREGPEVSSTQALEEKATQKRSLFSCCGLASLFHLQQVIQVFHNLSLEDRADAAVSHPRGHHGLAARAEAGSPTGSEPR